MLWNLTEASVPLASGRIDYAAFGRGSAGATM